MPGEPPVHEWTLFLAVEAFLRYRSHGVKVPKRPPGDGEFCGVHKGGCCSQLEALMAALWRAGSNKVQLFPEAHSSERTSHRASYLSSSDDSRQSTWLAHCWRSLAKRANCAACEFPGPGLKKALSVFVDEVGGKSRVLITMRDAPIIDNSGFMLTRKR